ncbi:MFS transporter [Actinophytocola oryzae]|uniref:Putative MFS family arabinose efflux permease n=1 Tax=Actinophytocola oryzae TaxID=502181 RepID=A0A4R7V088_9PSEU|nr:MFS transporter [Actinophytocola oryzae]TDV42668.1 putative MFS family arabinose efflux permease [Actinophytocola oryzae]
MAVMTASVTTPVADPPRAAARHSVVLFVLLGVGFMLSVDFSILNVALPGAGAGVGLDRADLAWITSTFALPAAGFTLLFGRLGDLFGRRRLLLLGMALLAGASMLGGLAAGPRTLLLARALQGLATAMAIPSAMSLLTTTFAEGPRRDRVLGLNGALACGGFTVGALLGGTLVTALGWRAAFFVNVPVAVAALLVTPFVIIESRAATRPRLDVPGAVTVTGGLLAVVYAVIERSLSASAVGVVLLVAFWLVERRASAPLVPPRILARPSVRWGNVAGLVTCGLVPAMIFMVTLYLQQVLGLSPLMTGLVLGVPGLASVAAGVVAGRAIGRFGPRPVLTVAMVASGLTTIALLFTSADRLSLVIVVPALFVAFFGHVAAMVAYTVTGTSGLPNGEQGLATGLTSMTQQVAGAVGIPVLSAIGATQVAQLAGLRLALGVDVVVTLVSAGLVWRGLRKLS